MTEEEIKASNVTVQKDWRELATNVLNFIRRNTGIPPELLSDLQPYPKRGAAQVGKVGLKFVDVIWRHPSPDPEPRGSFGLIHAEIDIITGETKVVTINDPEMIQYLARTQTN